MTSYSLLAFHLLAQLGGERGTVKDEDRRDVVVQQQAQASHAELDVPEREREGEREERKRLGREIEDRESRKGSVRQRAAARQRRGGKREKREEM
jgi:signal transduction histidine kinase